MSETSRDSYSTAANPVFRDAVAHFWESRRLQGAKQGATSGIRDYGHRTETTGGRQMNGFVKAIESMLKSCGVRASDIFSASHLELPGYYRATKKWDLLVMHGNRLVAAIELKSQVGSFGNNINNRVEEALGGADDIWTAYRDGGLGTNPAPWIGYLLLLQDSQESQKSVAVQEPHFPLLDEFRGASYARRYELFCRKLVRERKYSSACLLLADDTRSEQSCNYTEPAQDLGAEQFMTALRCAALAAIGA
jgi:hypothetical protein